MIDCSASEGRMMAEPHGVKLAPCDSFSVGEIRQTVSGANLLVEFNTDADAAAEMSVTLTNRGLLGTNDFFL